MAVIVLWIVIVALGACIGIMFTAIHSRNERIKELEDGIIQANQAWQAIKASIVTEDPLKDIAMEYVKTYDVESQSGEWKFHQAYAAVLKDKRIINRGFEKWKIGVAIHDALRELRIHEQARSGSVA